MAIPRTVAAGAAGVGRTDGGYGPPIKRPLLLDLDDTLIPDLAVTAATWRATAAIAAQRHALDADALADAAQRRSRELWREAPVPAALRANFAARDAMWCRFEDERPDLPHLPAWAAGYRRDTWALALADLGVSDPELAEELGRRWAAERLRRHELFPDTLTSLARLRERHAVAVVTNGPSHLQRCKLAGTGLADSFDAVVISGDLGIAKPDVAIFRHALDRLGLDGAGGAMIGDNLATDIAGARAAGLRAIWIDRHGAGPPDDPDVARVTTLADAVSLLDRR